MAKKMDFVEFISDLPDEEGDEQEVDLASEQESIPPGIYYRVSGSKVGSCSAQRRAKSG